MYYSTLTLKALKDAEDCADILKDLGRIKYTIAHGSEQEARALDYELQQKYPAIDAMLQAADNLQATRIRCKVIWLNQVFGIFCSIANITHLIFRILSNTPTSQFGFESQVDQISPEIKPLQ